jgi:alpha/beta superfamily hydrolase
MTEREVQLKLPSPVGFLEALFYAAPQRTESSADDAAPAPCRGGAIILHPHPLYSGNMQNKVVFTCQRACAEMGLSTLRYNSRGVGLSAGSYDDGQGEQNDLLAAIDYMNQHLRSLPLYIVGFSFGAWLGLKIGAANERVRGLVAIGTPVGWAELDFLARCEKPKLFIHGTKDQFCDPGELEKSFGLMAEPKLLYWVVDSDHFFTEHLDELKTLLVDNFPCRED